MANIRYAAWVVIVIAAMSMLFACGTKETPPTPTAIARVTAVGEATSEVDATAVTEAPVVTVYKPPT